jgi:hypothetical protein
MITAMPFAAHRDQPAFYEMGGATPVFITKEQAHVFRQRSLKKMRKAAERGDSLRWNALMHRYFNSHAVKVASLAKASKKGAGHSDEMCNELAQELSVWEQPTTSISVREIPKLDGSTRRIYIYDLKVKALQHMVADVLRAALPRPEHIYLIRRHPGEARNSGAARAVDFVRSQIDYARLIDGMDYRYAVLFDIKDCFDRTAREPLFDILPLPKEIIENVVLSKGQDITSIIRRRPRGSPYRRPHMHNGPTHKASGTPQGSVISDVVIATLFADMDNVFPPHVAACLYGDDGCVLCPTATEANLIARTLEAYFHDHPAGPYALKICEVEEIENGFDYLGYQLMPTDEGVSVELGWNSRNRIASWLLEKLKEAVREDYVLPDSLDEQILKKLSGYPMLDDYQGNLSWIMRISREAMDVANDAAPELAERTLARVLSKLTYSSRAV